MISTRINEIVGIEYPLFQGGMAWISDGRLAAAVSEAGGLGIIASGNAPADYVLEQIRTAASLTDKPFGVNLMLMSPYADEIAEIIAREKVKVVTTGAGNPLKYMKKWKEAGAAVIPVVASVAMAKLMTRVGASALIAEGTESGGHIGELSTIALVPQVCSCTDLPVIAAGGIADGRGFAAAFMLGAEGVQMGTRFLLAEECDIHRNYKDRLIKAGDLDTVVTGRRLGHPIRSLKTPFSREYAKAEYSDISDEDLEKMGEGTVRLAAKEGDVSRGTFLAGQAAAMVTKEQKAAEIVKEVCTEAEICLKGGCKWVK